MVMRRDELINIEFPPKEDLPEPHFDEEATVLSARPVVPLTEVESKAKNREWLPFAATIAVAVLLGAAAATLMYSIRSQALISDEVTSSGKVLSEIPVEGSENIEVVADGDSSPGMSDETEAPLNESGDISARGVEAPVTSDRNSEEEEVPPKAKLVDVIRERRSDTQKVRRQEETEEPREEKRPRRVREQQNQDRRDDSSDDLFRIQEIFEGAERP